jgi:hypothetical protein
MAMNNSPIALYAASDQVKAQTVLQSLGSVSAVAVPDASLGQAIQSLPSVLGPVAAGDPIILLIGRLSRNSALFQSIAFYTQQTLKRLIVIDLENLTQGVVSGNLGNFANSVVAASDPDMPDLIEGEDRWTLPSGASPPKRKIKRQKKC